MTELTPEEIAAGEQARLLPIVVEARALSYDAVKAEISHIGATMTELMQGGIQTKGIHPLVLMDISDRLKAFQQVLREKTAAGENLPKAAPVVVVEPTPAPEPEVKEIYEDVILEPYELPAPAPIAAVTVTANGQTVPVVPMAVGAGVGYLLGDRIGAVAGLVLGYLIGR